MYSFGIFIYLLLHMMIFIIFGLGLSYGMLIKTHTYHVIGYMV
jgi:hypothetical protein